MYQAPLFDALPAEEELAKRAARLRPTARSVDPGLSYSDRVAYVLEHFPEARGSDTILTVLYWYLWDGLDSLVGIEDLKVNHIRVKKEATVWCIFRHHTPDTNLTGSQNGDDGWRTEGVRKKLALTCQQWLPGINNGVEVNLQRFLLNELSKLHKA